MLKSTHKRTSILPLPAGWTEHVAPSGHPYYFNTTTKVSTYTRPTPESVQSGQAPVNGDHPDYTVGLPGPPGGLWPVGPASLSNPFVGHGQHAPKQGGFRGQGDFSGGRGYQERQRRVPEDRPKSKHVIPGCEPWLLVKTKLGRRFVYDPEKKESFWKFPPQVLKGVIEYDRVERERKQRRERGEESDPENVGSLHTDGSAAEESGDEVVQPTKISGGQEQPAEESDEYEEVEVTDNEEEGGSPKRRKLDDNGEELPVEFNEDDIAYQLAAMGQEYGLDPGEYGNGDTETWEEGAEGLALTEEDSHALFKDLLNDYNINPYAPWGKVIEDGRIIEDDRYTVLPNMKSRKDVWGDWTRERIQKLKEQREKAERQDPRIPYLAFLQKFATPKLYWPEFKRKYKKEPEMRDVKVTDKEREKLYRDHINRLKLPESKLKSDLSTLLKFIPPDQINQSTSLAALPGSVLTDIRYISLSPSIRDPLIEAYISTLPPAPEVAHLSPEEGLEHNKDRDARERRERALAEREKRVQEEKRKQQGALNYSKGILREGEQELQKALRVGKHRLLSHLKADPHKADIALAGHGREIT